MVEIIQGRLVFSDEADAIRYWQHREWKTFAVDVAAGPLKKPSYRQTFYVRARTPDGAIAAMARHALNVPRGARKIPRLAGPRELGCIPTN